MKIYVSIPVKIYFTNDRVSSVIDLKMNGFPLLSILKIQRRTNFFFRYVLSLHGLFILLPYWWSLWYISKPVYFIS